MEQEKPTDSENSAPVRRRRIIGDASDNPPTGDSGPEKPKNRTRTLPVSYTHLTLPTIYSV